MLKIGFGKVARPDFAFHETGVVRFGNIAKPYYANNRKQYFTASGDIAKSGKKGKP